VERPRTAITAQEHPITTTTSAMTLVLQVSPTRGRVMRKGTYGIATWCSLLPSHCRWWSTSSHSSSAPHSDTFSRSRDSSPLRQVFPSRWPEPIGCGASHGCESLVCFFDQRITRRFPISVSVGTRGRGRYRQPNAEFSPARSVPVSIGAMAISIQAVFR
jgi:hypothetical protein